MTDKKIKEMNMKKKIFGFCLALVLIVPTLFLISACGSKNPQVYENFVFDENKMIGYLGEDTEIVIPSSYSIRETSDSYTLKYNITDIINYGDESSLDYEIWSPEISEFERFILVGGMYDVSINGGEKQYVKVGETEAFFEQVKKDYTDPSTTISIELSDYVLTPEDEIDESNFTIIIRPFMEMLAGRLGSFSMTYDGNIENFTRQNYIEKYPLLLEIAIAGPLTGNITYDIGNYIEFIEGDDYKVDTISSLDPSYVLDGGEFFKPLQLTTVTIPSSITTIETGAFDSISTLNSVIVESKDIYNSLTDITSCGGLISNATSISVLKEIVDDVNNTNEFLTVNGGYTKTENENYYVFTK